MKKRILTFIMVGLISLSNINFVNAKNNYITGKIDIPNYQYIITNKKSFQFSIKSNLKNSIKNQDLEGEERTINIEIQTKSKKTNEEKKITTDEYKYIFDATKYKVGDNISLRVELKKDGKILAKDSIQFTIKDSNKYAYIDYGLKTTTNWNTVRYEKLNISVDAIIYDSKGQKNDTDFSIEPIVSSVNKSLYRVQKDKEAKQKFNIELDSNAVKQEKISLLLGNKNTNIPAKNNLTSINVRDFDYIEKIDSYQKEIVMNRGDELFLTPEYYPSDSMEIHNVKWVSSDNNIALVNIQGMLKAKGKGTAYVTVQSKYAKFTYKVKVVVNLNQIKLPDDIKLQVGIKEKLNYTLDPKDADINQLSFRSEDSSVLSVDEKGVMTPHKVGETKISVVYGKYKVSTTVKVIPQLKEIIAPKEVELYENTASSLAISTNPVRFDDLKSAKYQTSDKNVATISKDGTITTKSVGECYITITYGKVSSKTKVIVKPYKNSEVKILKDSVNISSDYDLRNLLEGDYDSEKIQYYHDNNVIIKNHQFIVQKAGQYMVGIKYNDDTTYVEINVVDEKNNEEIDVEGLVKKILGIVSGMLKELLQ